MLFFQKYFKQSSRVLLSLVLLITVFSLWRASKLHFDYDFESFFPKDDNGMISYNDFRKNFEYDNEFLLIGIENKTGVFRKDFLLRVQALTDSLSHLKNVERLLSPTHLRYPVIGPLGRADFLYLNPGSDSSLPSDSIRIYNSPELPGSFISRDAKSVSIFLKTTEGISKVKSDTLLAQIESRLALFHFDKTHLAGKIKAQQVYLEKLKSEFVIFFFSSLTLVILFLYISFRSFWGIAVPLLIVILSIIWTLGLMNLCGKDLDIMAVLLPTMIFVVGMSDAVHLLTKYLEEIRSGKDKGPALLTTLKEVGFPTFLTLITTAIGFLTLLVSNLKPIRDFGIYTSAGVLISFVLAYTLMPLILLWIPKPGATGRQHQHRMWEVFLENKFRWIMKRRSGLAFFTVLLVIVSVWGISLISQNNTLLEPTSRGDQLQADFHFFESQFSGVRPFEMVVVDANGKSLMAPETIRTLDKLENYLRGNYGLGFILSTVTLVKELNKAFHGGNPGDYKLPENPVEFENILSELKARRKSKELRLYLSASGEMGRISGKMHDVGSQKVREMDKSLAAWSKTNLPSDLKYTLTGGAVMVDRHNDYLVKNMIQGFGLSIFAVGFVILLIHRSWKMVLISIIPNLIPILVIGAFMGFAGIELKSSTSIIFSIAFGIATDDTIHFLGRLKLELDKGLGLMEATRKTYVFTGKAVIVTSLILSAGFLTLISSGFQSTFYFGLLTSLTLLIAVFIELLLFPLLVVWLYRPESGTGIE